MPSSNQENAEVRAYRYMQIEQGHLFKQYKCDMCGNFATQTHEIYYRSMTLNNPEARRLSFQKELLAQLCERCHLNAHTQTATHLLLKRNIDVYGYDAVEEALNLVQQQLKGLIRVLMPKREETSG